MNSIDQPNTPHAAEKPPELDGARMLSDHAASAARIVGHPRAFVAPVPSARSTFALDVAPDAVPGHVAATTVQAAIVVDARRGTP